MQFNVFLIQNNNAESWVGTTHIDKSFGVFQSCADAIQALEAKNPGMTDERYIRPDDREDVAVNFTYFSIIQLPIHGYDLPNSSERV